jgi:phosphoribosylformimino-5-aminoimidazole carboxamide ribotide isomerase
MIELIPALDLLGNNVVRLAQGDYDKVTEYSDDPVGTALKFKEVGVKRLHIVDLDGAKKGSCSHSDIIIQIKKETGVVIEAGGGVRTLSAFENYFNNGLNINEDFIMIGSLPFQNPDEFKKIYLKYAQNILHTVDVWGRDVKFSGWKESANINVLDHLKKMQDTGITNYLVTQIKKDGMLTGPDVELYQEINNRYSNINVIVSGGVSGIQDVGSLKSIGNLNGFIVGRAFYENRISLNDIKEYQLLNE